jgi:hypothetical protein
MIGFLVFLCLSTLALVAGLSGARRMRFESRAERLLAASMLASALIVTAVSVPGFLQMLTPLVLGIESAALFGSALALSCWRAPAGHLRASLKDLALPALLTAEAFTLTWRARSFALFGVAAALGVLAYTGWISYLAPSDAWDGIVYHEPMIGYALQQRGFEIVPTPRNFVHINTFPRNCEMTSLWFVAFWDRRLIDIVNNVYSVPVVLALFCIIRRYTDDIVTALGWTTCLVLIPGYALQLHSNYVDIHAAAFYFAGLQFATRFGSRIRDAILASLCFGLLLGAKSFALAWTPVLCAVALFALLVRHLRARPAAVAGAVLAGLSLVLLFGGPIYLRNWLVYENPLHPYVFDPVTRKLHSAEIGGTEFHKSLAVVFSEMLAPPKPGFDYVDTRQFGYGLALPFFMGPLALIGLAWCAWSYAKDLLGRLVGKPLGSTGNLVLTLLAPLTTYFYTPAFSHTRYNYPLVGGVLILLAWFLARARRMAEGTIAVSVITSMMWLYWAVPAWLVTFDEARRLAGMPAHERATQTTIGWSIGRDTAKERERLGPRDLVVYTDDIEFPAVLWNEKFSNRVTYTPMLPGDAMSKRLDELGAAWFVTSSLAGFFDKHPGWRRVGLVSGRPVYAYARVR